MRRIMIMLSAALLLPTLAFAPAFIALNVHEPTYGDWTFYGDWYEVVTLEVPANQALDFSWLGDVEDTGRTIDGYRYGWDVTDPNDSEDVGWATPDFVADLLSAPTMSFPTGAHKLHIRVRDDTGLISQGVFLLMIQPEVPATVQSWGKVKAAFRD